MRDSQSTQLTVFDSEFEKHYSRFRKQVAAQVRAVLAKWSGRLQPDQVDEEVANLMAGVVKARKNFDPEQGPFLPWANTVAMRRLADWQRQLGRESKRPTISCRASFPDGEVIDLLLENPAGRDSEVDPRVEAILSGLNELPPREQEAVRKRYLEGVGYEVIASALGCPSKAAARGMVCRGLKRLSERVKAAEQPPDEPDPAVRK